MLWRQEKIDGPAKPFFRRDAPIEQEPLFDTSDWWACVTAQKLRNLELASHRLGAESPYGKPSNLTALPVEVLPSANAAEDVPHDNASAGNAASDSDTDAGARGTDFDDVGDEQAPVQARERSAFPLSESLTR